VPATADPYSTGPLPQATDLGVRWAFPLRTHLRQQLFHSGVRIERLKPFRMELAALLTRQDRKTYGGQFDHLCDLIHDLKL
jgi:hypothetical protein